MGASCFWDVCFVLTKLAMIFTHKHYLVLICSKLFYFQKFVVFINDNPPLTATVMTLAAYSGCFPILIPACSCNFSWSGLVGVVCCGQFGVLYGIVWNGSVKVGCTVWYSLLWHHNGSY